MCVRVCMCVCALTGRHAIIDPHDYKVGEQVGVLLSGGVCVSARPVHMTEFVWLQITWISVLPFLKGACRQNYTATSATFKSFTELTGNFS